MRRPCVEPFARRAATTERSRPTPIFPQQRRARPPRTKLDSPPFSKFSHAPPHAASKTLFSRQLYKPGRDNCAAALFQNQLRQRFGRRPGQHPAILRRKNSPMARAGKNILLLLKKNRASMMSAQPAERDVPIFGGPQQKTRPVVLRIGKHFRTANRNLADLGNGGYRIRLIPPTQECDHRAYRRQRNSDANIPGEAPAAHGLRCSFCPIFRSLWSLLAHVQKIAPPLTRPSVPIACAFATNAKSYRAQSGPRFVLPKSPASG